jgi:hypothetical protein
VAPEEATLAVVAVVPVDQGPQEVITPIMEHLAVLEKHSLLIPDLFSGQCPPHGNLPLALQDSLLVAAVVVETIHPDQMVALVAVVLVMLVIVQEILVLTTPEAAAEAAAVTEVLMVVMVAMVLLF